MFCSNCKIFYNLDRTSTYLAILLLDGKDYNKLFAKSNNLYQLRGTYYLESNFCPKCEIKKPSEVKYKPLEK
jgi:hypothetical protein